MSNIFKFNLGDECKDLVTGFKGIVMARTQWFNGCVRYVLSSRKLTEGKLPDEAVLDEAQMDLVKPDACAPNNLAEQKVKAPGGPRKDQRSPVSAAATRTRSKVSVTGRR